MDPLVFGDYPSSMRTLVGDRLPQFTKEQSELVKGSYDFIGLNYYTSFYVVDTGVSINIRNKSSSIDSRSSISGIYFNHVELAVLPKKKKKLMVYRIFFLTKSIKIFFNNYFVEYIPNILLFYCFKLI